MIKQFAKVGFQPVHALLAHWCLYVIQLRSIKQLPHLHKQ